MTSTDMTNTERVVLSGSVLSFFVALPLAFLVGPNAMLVSFGASGVFIGAFLVLEIWS